MEEHCLTPTRQGLGFSSLFKYIHHTYIYIIRTYVLEIIVKTKPTTRTKRDSYQSFILGCLIMESARGCRQSAPDAISCSFSLFPSYLLVFLCRLKPCPVNSMLSITIRTALTFYSSLSSTPRSRQALAHSRAPSHPSMGIQGWLTSKLGCTLNDRMWERQAAYLHCRVDLMKSGNLPSSL